MEKKLKTIIILIAILVLVAINLIVFLYINQETTTQTNDLKNNNATENNVQEDIYENQAIESIVNNKISSMEDDNRIKSYCGKFIRYIENKDYETAYNCLNDTFKATYFPTLEEFSEYIAKKYPKNKIVVEYNTVDRKGEVFVLGITIDDMTDTNFQKFSESVVIREISANNFSLSFSKDYKDTNERSK